MLTDPRTINRVDTRDRGEGCRRMRMGGGGGR